MARSHNRRSMKRAFIWMICVLLIGSVLGFADARKEVPLFRIERSMNANIVHYDANLTPEGDLDPKNPIAAYWIMHTKGGNREDLTWIERSKAFGFKVIQDPGGDFVTMELKADIQRKIKVYKVKGRFRAETTIEGHPAFLERVHVQCTRGILLPKVEYLEFFGKDIKTGHQVYEKLTPP